MKNIVISDEYHEVDVKPTGLMNEYIAQVQNDVLHLVLNHQELISIQSPIDGLSLTSAFNKMGLAYERSLCHSLFVNPRPLEPTLKNYYLTAESRAFWLSEIARETRNARDHKLVKPRVQWVLDTTQEYHPSASRWLDFSPHLPNYANDIAANDFFSQKKLLDPYFDRAVSELHSSIQVIDENWTDYAQENSADVVTVFEVADRVSDLNRLCSQLKRITAPGGLICITSILASGFDVLVLGERAQNIFPPDRLNVLTVEAWMALCRRYDFSILEFSTPGVLDVDRVRSTNSLSADGLQNSFADYLMQRDENTLSRFQDFLQANLLSSYGRIVLKNN